MADDTKIEKKNGSEGEKEEDFYTALGHKIRREIIKLIGKNEFAGFSQMKKITGASTGTIYHHLEILEDLITQDKSKKYHLTELGEHAYKFLGRNLDSIESTEVSEKILNSEHSNGKKWLERGQFKKVFQYLLENRDQGIFASMFIISVVALICGFFDIRAYLYFFIPGEDVRPISEPNSNTGIFDFGIFFSVILGSLIIFGIIELLCRFIFGKRENPAQLLSIFGISYIPMIFYLLIVVIFKIGEIGPLRITFLLVFQVWSMVLLAYSISLTKNIRFERGLIISVFLDYGAFIYILLIRNPEF